MEKIVHEEREDYRSSKKNLPLEKVRDPYVENSRYSKYRDYPTPGGSTGSDLGYTTASTDLNYSGSYSQNSTPATNYDYYYGGYHPNAAQNSYLQNMPQSISPSLPLQQNSALWWPNSGINICFLFIHSTNKTLYEQLFLTNLSMKN